MQKVKAHTRLVPDTTTVQFLEHIVTPENKLVEINVKQLKVGHKYIFAYLPLFDPNNPHLEQIPNNVTLIRGEFIATTNIPDAHFTTITITVNKRFLVLYLASVVAIIQDACIRAVVWRSTAISLPYVMGMCILADAHNIDNPNGVNVTKSECIKEAKLADAQRIVKGG